MPKPFRFEQICDGLKDLLGVPFAYDADEPATVKLHQAAGALDTVLPPELLHRLKFAASVYSVTEFDAHLNERDARAGSAPRV